VAYDANAAAGVSHFVVSSTNLATASVSGLYQVGTLNAGYVAGYMAAIPSEWQGVLGAPYLTGQSNLSIVTRTSSGPAAFGFNPQTLGAGANPATPYLYYPANNPLGPYEGSANPIESGTTAVNGAVFVPGTSSLLYFGSTGTSYDGYGVGNDWGTGNSFKGPASLNGQYAMQVWAYNANDLAAVKNGTLQPWQVQPYDVWNLNIPVASGDTTLGGVAFDPASGRVYVSVLYADDAQPYTYLPLIEVFQVTTGTASGPVAPQIGTLTGAPVIAPQNGTAYFDMPQAVGTYVGPVHRGDPVQLTAGNVYAITPGGTTVTQVAFYISPNGNTSPFSTSIDTLLGYGTPSTTANAGHNYNLTISTSGLTAGTYRVFAVALDSNGLLSNPIAWTLTIQ
jgi:hypothetical protein